MKVLLLTGSHCRHLYLAKKLLESNFLTGLLIEKREEFIPQPPKGLDEIDHNNFIRHFEGRAEAERSIFGRIDDSEFHGISKIKINQQKLNSDKVKKWIKKQNPDIVLTYGVHIINDDLLAEFPDYSWNVHGGLSPWYRGCITLFWPFYFLQPNWAGMTIHYLSSELDGGEIVHHSRPELKYGDGIHDVGARAVVQVADDLVKILGLLKKGEKLPKESQKSTGKLFLARDWKLEHLRLIYNTFDNNIVDYYLDGKFNPEAPQLVKAFKD
ncbi:methionyl-tRNA formyltransferase [Halobacteroides halobius DSM 5150]|uniref:Methionyl-tRNA formyltransferase n=1 Tax=Halobacteroides halobius (strain ATCC 35273 / DSM 5150 / MD-1) TaxID=748449 RepID=L0KCK1_HALHC|nr:formyltransferase family protein [Halobacteroides halobius]AGB42114.1 methionyl-tRNA formyltransferase [Halobacteroides halobius DSM 5150]